MHLLRITALLLFITLSRQVYAQHHHTTDHPAVHGMVMFGQENVYASHLPLFHAPHQYQILLELQLKPADLARWQAEQQAHPESATYTIAPEPFVLTQMLDKPKPFKARLYRGHFERGGTPVGDSLAIKIKRVIYKQALPTDTNSQSINRMIVFGSPKEQFAAHLIRQQPDFDQIIQVQPVEPATSQPPTNILTLTAENDGVLGVSGNVITATKPDNTSVPLRLLKQIYLEFADLK